MRLLLSIVLLFLLGQQKQTSGLSTHINSSRQIWWGNHNHHNNHNNKHGNYQRCQRSPSLRSDVVQHSTRNKITFALEATRVTSTDAALLVEVESKPKQNKSTKNKTKTIKKKTKVKKVTVKAKVGTRTRTRAARIDETVDVEASTKSATVTATVTRKTRKATPKAAKKATTTKKQTKKKTAAKDEPAHFYRNETDSISILRHDSKYIQSREELGTATATASATGTATETGIATGTETRIKDTSMCNVSAVGFKVRGNPVPLARHRTYRGFVFNPSAKKQKQFCDVVLEMLPNTCFQQNVSTDTDTDVPMPITKDVDTVIPVFKDQVISIQIISRMKRPNKHFIANRPGPGRLRQSSNDDSVSGSVSVSDLQVTRTDVDNLAKFVLDSLNGVLYEDDKQVASLQVTKVYDHEDPYTGSTDVIIRVMNEKDLYAISNINVGGID
jgi:Holliday junction resolvase RusA-like endonuclease